MSTNTSHHIINHRYVLRDRIGVGSFGVVYRAKDRLTGNTVALKHVTASTAQLMFSSRGDESSLDLALAQEFRTLASLRHPHIISVLDYGFDQNRQPYFTMELLENANTILEAGEGKPIETQITLLIELLQALIYLHRRAILHRDLKPTNVLMTEQGKVKVLDFGLSTTVERAKGSVGTLLYMAPEVLRDQPVDRSSDLFAVGVIAYQLLTRRYPFDLRSPNHVVSSILHHPPDFTTIENAHLARVVMTCLEKDPAARYGDAEEVIVALSKAIQQPPPQESIAIRESFLQTAPFIGRDTELNQLVAALDNALRGAGSTWLVGGESGVGKSRLVDELRTQALVKGALVLRGQGVEGGGLAYQLWRDVMPHLVLATTLSDLEAGVLKEIVPNISTLLGRDIPSAPEITGKAGQQRLALTINDVFRRQSQPVVLVLEDLQWATESLVPVKELNRIVAEFPLLLIGNYRNDERPNLPDELPGVQHIALERFAEPEVAELSISMLGASGQQSDVLDLLTKETEGNVFFLVEVARALAEEAGSLSDIGRATLPAQIFTGGMHNILRRRIERLPSDCHPLLQLAAVAGRQVDESLLRQMAPEMDVEQWLYQCASPAVLTVQDNRWQFSHNKLRELLVTDLSDEERPALYRQVAESIESVYPDDKERATALVQHWHMAGDTDKERHYAQIAGERAYTISAFREAIQLFGRALEITSQEDVKSRAVLLAKFGKSCEGLGDYPTATQHLKQGLALSRTVGDGETEVEALNGLSWIAYQQGGFNEAERYAKQALAQKIDDRQRIARSLNILGVVASNRGVYEAAQRYFEESLVIRRKIGDRRGIANSLNNLGLVASNRGDYEAAQRYFEESLVICREIGYRQGIANTLNNLGEVTHNRGNHEAAWQYLEESLVICREIGYRRGIALNLSNLGHVAAAREDGDAAWRCYRDALSESAEISAVSITLAALAGVARLLVQNRHNKRAAELLGLALHHPSTEVDDKQGAELPLATLREKLPADQLEAALERGKALDLETVVQELLEEFTLTERNTDAG